MRWKFWQHPAQPPPAWEPRDDDEYDWSMMREVKSARGGSMTVGPEGERPRPKDGVWYRCSRCGSRGWDADWGGPHRCTLCKGVGWREVDE